MHLKGLLKTKNTIKLIKTHNDRDKKSKIKFITNLKQ